MEQQKNKLTKLDICCIVCVVLAFVAEIILLSVNTFWSEVGNYRFFKFAFENDILHRILKNIRNYISTTITIIFTLVITIVSISLSLAHESIYGLTFAKFRRLNLKGKYSLTKIIILTIIIAVSSFVFYIFNLTFSLLVINFFAIFYCVFYVLQEVPILSRSTKKLHQIVKDAATYCLTNNLEEQSGDDVRLWCQDLRTAIGYLAYSEGVETTCNIIQIDDLRLSSVNYVLSCYAQTLKLKSNSLEKDTIGDIDNVIQGIEALFIRIQTFDLKEEKNLRYYNSGFVDLLFWLLDEIDNSKTNEHYGVKVEHLLLNYVLPCSNSLKDELDGWNDYVYNLSNRILVESYSRQDFQYIEWICLFANYPLSNRTYEFDSNYMVFISLFINGVCGTNFEKTFEEKVEKVKDDVFFAAEVSASLFEYKENIYPFSKTISMLQLIMRWWNDCKQISKNIFTPRKTCVDLRDESYLVNWWINLLLTFDEHIMSSQQFINRLLEENVDNKLLYFIKKNILENWSDSISIENNFCPFISYFKKYYDPFYDQNIKPLQNNVIRYLHDFACYVEPAKQKTLDRNTSETATSFFQEINDKLRANGFYSDDLVFDDTRTLNLSIGYNNYDFDKAQEFLFSSDYLYKKIICECLFDYLHEDNRFERYSDLEIKTFIECIFEQMSKKQYINDGLIGCYFRGHEYRLASFNFKAELVVESSKIIQYAEDEASIVLDIFNFDKDKNQYLGFEEKQKYSTKQELLSTIGSNLFLFDLHFKFVFDCELERI